MWFVLRRIYKEGGLITLALDSPRLQHFASWIPTTPDSPVLIFDVETDALLREATKLHSIVIKSLPDGKVFSAYTPSELREAIKMLNAAPVVVAHNGIRFDSPVLQKLMPGCNLHGKMFDTLVALRLIYGDGDDFKLRDYQLIKKNKTKLPPALMGRHSLEAWGYRLGCEKGHFGKTADWSIWTPEMQRYCEQDVEVLEQIYRHVLSHNCTPLSLAIEMAFAEIIHEQVEFGFPFDTKAAEALYTELCAERAELKEELEAVFPPEEHEEVFIPKRNNKTKGYIAGEPFIKKHIIPFNPGSRQQVAKRLQEKFGWEPVEYTETGEAKVDGGVLDSLPYPEAKVLSRWYELSKIIGMVAEGQNGWLKLVTSKNRIHGEVNTNGAVTGRCTHSKPNLAQVPKKGELGSRCRACFAAPPGWVQMGADASGLELRMFGHFVARYDGGKYVSIVLDGDVHTENQKAAGLPTRDSAKTFIYAFLYGAGDEKLGSIIEPHASPKRQAIAGGNLRKRFLTKLPALKRLVDAVKDTAKNRKGILIGIDGRKLKVRSQHAALNVVLQSAGAVLVKMATIVWHMKIQEETEYQWGKDFAQVAHVHDECQSIARSPEIAEHLGKLFVEAIELSGQFFNFRCPTTGEYKLGKNWQETH